MKSNLEHWRPLWETFEFLRLIFLKMNWTAKSVKLSNLNGMPIFIGIFAASKCYQGSKTASVQSTIFKITEADK